MDNPGLKKHSGRPDVILRRTAYDDYGTAGREGAPLPSAQDPISGVVPLYQTDHDVDMMAGPPLRGDMPHPDPISAENGDHGMGPVKVGRTSYPWDDDEPVDYQYERTPEGSPIEPSPNDDLRKLEGLGWQISRHGPNAFRTDDNGVEHRLYPMWKQNMGRRYWDMSSAIDGPNGTRRTEQNFFRTPEEAHAAADEISARLGTDPDLGESGVVGLQHRRTTDWPVETRSLFDRMSAVTSPPVSNQQNNVAANPVRFNQPQQLNGLPRGQVLTGPAQQAANQQAEQARRAEQTYIEQVKGNGESAANEAHTLAQQGIRSRMLNENRVARAQSHPLHQAVTLNEEFDS